MKVLGLDFEGTKIRTAELLHSDYLIRQKGAGAGTGQKSDPNSLLTPPSGNRDNSLPSIYLAARADLDDVTAIPIPSTKAVGWRSLGYFDPPERKGGKPQLIASPPCVVFQTIASDGRMHAHRIYLSETGKAKAELGTLPNGKTRDPKKSARRSDGQPSTAGCAVIWGEPNTCPDQLLAEGIENAAAIAYAFKSELERGEIVIAPGSMPSASRPSRRGQRPSA